MTDTKNRVLQLLAFRTMTPSQIAKQLNVADNDVQRELDELFQESLVGQDQGFFFRV